MQTARMIAIAAAQWIAWIPAAAHAGETSAARGAAQAPASSRARSATSTASDIPALPVVLMGSGLASFAVSVLSLTQIEAATDSIQRFCGPEESCPPNVSAHYISRRRDARARWRATLVGSGLLGIGLLGAGVYLWVDHEARSQDAAAGGLVGVAIGPERADVNLRVRF